MLVVFVRCYATRVSNRLALAGCGMYVNSTDVPSGKSFASSRFLASYSYLIVSPLKSVVLIDVADRVVTGRATLAQRQHGGSAATQSIVFVLCFVLIGIPLDHQVA